MSLKDTIDSGKRCYCNQCKSLLAAVAAARAEEREACAKIAESCRGASGGFIDLMAIAGQNIAAEIRARGAA